MKRRIAGHAFADDRKGVGTGNVFELKKDYSVRDIVRWIYTNNELNKQYHVFERNCQHFTSKLRDELS